MDHLTGLVLTDVPEPDVAPDEVLIRVQRMSICGTDLHIDDWNEWAAATVDQATTRFGTGSREALLTRRSWKLVGVDT